MGRDQETGENIARIHELLAEARRRSNQAADHKTPDLWPSVIPPGGLEDTWSEAVQDLQLPDDVLDSLQLADWDDLLGTLDLGGLDDPGNL